MNFIVKNTSFVGLLDLIAPHSCRGCGAIGEPICECCKKYILNQKTNFCPKCKTKTTRHRCPHCKALPPTFFVGERSDLLDTIIHEYKYDSVRAFAKPLASLLAARLPKFPPHTFIVPLPTATHHIRSRALDHTHKLALHLAKIRHCKVQRLLLREQNTTQVGASRSARLTQAEKAYSVNPKITVDPSATYILLDDIWTTGASMEAAVKKLRQAGAKNIIITLLAVSRLN